MEITADLKAVTVHSHNFYRKGKFISYYKKGEKVFALIETERGTERFEISGRYHLEFE